MPSAPYPWGWRLLPRHDVDDLAVAASAELDLTGGEGEESTLAIEGSPAVYGNLMIIGTTGKDAGGVYCIKIE